MTMNAQQLTFKLKVLLEWLTALPHHPRKYELIHALFAYMLQKDVMKTLMLPQFIRLRQMALYNLTEFAALESNKALWQARYTPVVEELRTVLQTSKAPLEPSRCSARFRAKYILDLEESYQKYKETETDMEQQEQPPRQRRQSARLMSKNGMQLLVPQYVLRMYGG